MAKSTITASCARELDARGMAPDGGWRGHSDTETLLEAIAAWGLETALERAVGMFAFGLWDRAERKLYLVRDRFGEKPLYYGWVGGDFLFGSELKALTAHPRFDNEISREALTAFASRTYVPAPLSIYRRIFKLPPGCILKSTQGRRRRRSTNRPAEGAADGPAPPAPLLVLWRSPRARACATRSPTSRRQSPSSNRRLRRSIAGQSMADVPVGAFLSGGIDSSTVVALYQKYSSVPGAQLHDRVRRRAFQRSRICAPRVAAISARFITSNMSRAREAAEVIPLLPADVRRAVRRLLGHPDLSSSAASPAQQVKVVLSGDGGDELFAGYRRHWQALAMWNKLQRIPAGARRAGAAAAGLFRFGSGPASTR